MINGDEGRKNAEKKLEALITNIQKKGDRQNLIKEIYGKFGISPDTVSDMLAFRKEIGEFNNFEIFAVLWFLDRDNLSKYFTAEEISGYSTEKADETKITLPITLNVIQVNDNQWIGATSMSWLMSLRNSQMINYRENAQRVFKVVKSGGVETLRISINKKAVESIKESILNGTYIPDDITLNMPDGSRFSFSNNELIIYELPDGKFDIIDGYHRYLAMCSINNFNKDIDYPMEIRITNFDLGTCQQMIYQKDQKTVMRKVESDTFNQYSIGNQIASAINKDGGCNLSGMIGRVNTGIDMATFSALITKYFIPAAVKKSDEALLKVNVKKELVRKFNNVTEERVSLLHGMDARELFILMYIFSHDISENQYLEAFDYLKEKTENDDPHLFALTKNGFRRKSENVLSKYIEEWRDKQCGTMKKGSENS